MKQKTQLGYERVMRKILELRPGLNPVSIMVDFLTGSFFYRTFPTVAWCERVVGLSDWLAGRLHVGR